ncbi:MAG: hypothetical protein FGF48_06220 [Candidatus Brockarchaeota archaeon]|nr:hypothetical protein [Candidatus Brockarchaeota archaeon]
MEMNRTRSNTRGILMLAILIAVAVSAVNAAVFVYYPMGITASWSKRPIYFDTEETNAGGPDLSGTIQVSLSDEGTVASVTVHPSRRGTTLYHNIMKIKNEDAQTYYLWIKVNTAFDDQSISEAVLIVDSTEINLRETGVTSIGSISEGGELSVSLRLKISSTGPGTDSASIELVYSPQSTEPPP